MESALIWFRRDLRLDDNGTVAEALAAARRVRAVFVFDSDILEGLAQRADRRVEFIHGSVGALKERLEALGGTLHVVQGPARLCIPELARRWDAQAVFAARDYEPFARQRDAAVAAALAREGRSLHLLKDQVVFEMDEVLSGAGRPFHVFTPYKRAWLSRLDAAALAGRDVSTLADRLVREAPASFPGLGELGFLPTGLAELGVVPGESGAQARLVDFLARILRYGEARDYPARKGPSYLSVHLRFGTVSIRKLVQEARDAGGEGAAVWLSELIWREFYQMLLWHYPATAEHAFQARFDALPWPNPAGHFAAWQAGRTGYPLVDAAMRQLDRTGYMHNRLRMLAASFLVKDLHVDWRLGERHFAEKLLDYDQAANVGGWQWSAGVGTDAQPWFRVFNPVAQSERFDPEGRFIRRYLPELAGLPDRFIHAPWRAGAGAAALDYPPPIVDHATARAATLALFRAAQ
ncbi:MAG: deoxyribodipyrimidine photo-lyase [Pseudomonadota bacterium]